MSIENFQNNVRVLDDDTIEKKLKPLKQAKARSSRPPRRIEA
jgi:hypothetical protein